MTCAGIPLQELKGQLATVQSAISELLAGTKRRTLVVGSGSFSRRYEFTETTLQELTDLRERLLQQICAIEGANTLPTFRSNATIPLVVDKQTW